MKNGWSTKAKVAAASGGVLLASLGIGTSAYATPTSTAPSTGTPSSQTHSASLKGARLKLRELLLHSVEGSIVVKTKNGYVTVDAARGTITSVSSSSISITTPNNEQVTATIGSNTKFRNLTDAQLAKGDKVGLVYVNGAARLVISPKASASS